MDCPAPKLLPEAQPGVAVYLACCSTQWAYAGMGGRTGLRYDGCLPAMAQHLAEWQQRERAAGAPGLWCDLTLQSLLEDVQIIEGAILAVESERREQERQQAELDRQANNIRESF